MHIDKNQEVVYNIIVKKEEVNMPKIDHDTYVMILNKFKENSSKWEEIKIVYERFIGQVAILCAISDEEEKEKKLKPYRETARKIQDNIKVYGNFLKKSGLDDADKDSLKDIDEFKAEKLLKALDAQGSILKFSSTNWGDETFKLNDIDRGDLIIRTEGLKRNLSKDALALFESWTRLLTAKEHIDSLVYQGVNCGEYKKRLYDAINEIQSKLTEGGASLSEEIKKQFETLNLTEDREDRKDRVKKFEDLSTYQNDLIGTGASLERCRVEIDDLERDWKHFTSIKKKKKLNELNDNYNKLNTEREELQKKLNAICEVEFNGAEDFPYGEIRDRLDELYTPIIDLGRNVGDLSNQITAARNNLGVSKVNQHGLAIKHAIVGLTAATTIALILSWGGATDFAYVMENDQPSSGNEQGPEETITNVKKYQDEVNNKIENLKTASANWTQAYQDQLVPYYKDTAEDKRNENYNALMSMDSTSTSQAALDLAEERRNTIFGELDKISNEAKQVLDIISSGKKAPLTDLSQETIDVINTFRTSYLGTLNKVELSFEQTGDAIIRIYFDAVVNNEARQYMVDIGAFDAADRIIIKDGKVDEKILYEILGEKKSLSTAVYVNYVDQVDSFSIDGITVTAFYIDQGDIRNLITHPNQSTSVSLTIETADGVLYEVSPSIFHTSIKTQEDALLAIRIGALKELRDAGHTIGEVSTLDSEK